MKNRTCAHTYIGHTKAIRDIQFTNDGKHFLSCAFDGQVHYWDTEYGKGIFFIYFSFKNIQTEKDSFYIKISSYKSKLIFSWIK